MYFELMLTNIYATTYLQCTLVENICRRVIDYFNYLYDKMHTVR